MDIDVSVYRKKMEKYYDPGGKLLQYPPKRPMRILALVRIVQRLDPTARHTEKEINEAVRSSLAFGDIEPIRRKLYKKNICMGFHPKDEIPYKFLFVNQQGRYPPESQCFQWF